MMSNLRNTTRIVSFFIQFLQEAHIIDLPPGKLVALMTLKSVLVSWVALWLNTFNYLSTDEWCNDSEDQTEVCNK